MKFIKPTNMGRAMLGGVAQWSNLKENMKVTETAREMIMIMIPKRGRDHSKLRPIVFANVVGRNVGRTGQNRNV